LFRFFIACCSNVVRSYRLRQPCIAIVCIGCFGFQAAIKCLPVVTQPWDCVQSRRLDVTGVWHQVIQEARTLDVLRCLEPQWKLLQGCVLAIASRTYRTAECKAGSALKFRVCTLTTFMFEVCKPKLFHAIKIFVVDFCCYTTLVVLSFARIIAEVEWRACVALLVLSNEATTCTSIEGVILTPTWQAEPIRRMVFVAVAMERVVANNLQQTIQASMLVIRLHVRFVQVEIKLNSILGRPSWIVGKPASSENGCTIVVRQRCVVVLSILYSLHFVAS
jgi:hypothetical protein